MAQQPEKDSWLSRQLESPTMQIADAMHGWMGIAVAAVVVLVVAWMFIEPVVRWILGLF